MACKICGRSSCTESFHSIAEQAERISRGKPIAQQLAAATDVAIAGLCAMDRISERDENIICGVIVSSYLEFSEKERLCAALRALNAGRPNGEPHD